MWWLTDREPKLRAARAIWTNDDAGQASSSFRFRFRFGFEFRFRVANGAECGGRALGLHTSHSPDSDPCAFPIGQLVFDLPLLYSEKRVCRDEIPFNVLSKHLHKAFTGLMLTEPPSRIPSLQLRMMAGVHA